MKQCYVVLGNKKVYCQPLLGRWEIGKKRKDKMIAENAETIEMIANKFASEFCCKLVISVAV